MRPNADFYLACGCGAVLEWALDELISNGRHVACARCGEAYVLALPGGSDGGNDAEAS